MQYAENGFRKQITPRERAAIGDAIEDELLGNESTSRATRRIHQHGAL
jgi:hypothetical protein